MAESGDGRPPEPGDEASPSGRFRVQDFQSGHRIHAAELVRFIERVAGEISPGDPRGATLRILPDADIRDLNRRFRGRDRPTDVLAFPVETPPGAAGGAAGCGVGAWPTEDPYLGDLAVSADTAARQAAGFGWDLDTELRGLAVHGLLHLFGYDHERDRGEMDRLENLLRRRHGLPVGLPGPGGPGVSDREHV